MYNMAAWLWAMVGVLPLGHSAAATIRTVARSAVTVGMLLDFGSNAALIHPANSFPCPALYCPVTSQVDSMCQSQRRQLLAFVTSSSALPAGGFAALRGFNGAPHPFTGGLAKGCWLCWVGLLLGMHALNSGKLRPNRYPNALSPHCRSEPGCVRGRRAPATGLHLLQPPALPSAFRLPTAAVSLVVCEGDERLPRASTCFNHLHCPPLSASPLPQ